MSKNKKSKADYDKQVRKDLIDHQKDQCNRNSKKTISVALGQDETDKQAAIDYATLGFSHAASE